MEIRLIVADNARARIFASHSDIRRLQERADFVHPEARLSNSDLVGDAAGKSIDGRSSLDPATSPKQHQAETFARSLARHLKEMHDEQHYEELILIAPPKFLGMLRAELPAQLERLVTRTVNKDLTTAGVAEIIDALGS
jgi:protein required for attachment to host cells